MEVGPSPFGGLDFDLVRSRYRSGENRDSENVPGVQEQV